MTESDLTLEEQAAALLADDGEDVDENGESINAHASAVERANTDDRTDMPPALGPADVCEILKNVRRHAIIELLDGEPEGESVEAGDIATRITAWECATPAEEVASEDRHRVYASLYRAHLPKLEGCGVVEVDGRNRVTRGPNFEVLCDARDAIEGALGLAEVEVSDDE